MFFFLSTLPLSSLSVHLRWNCGRWGEERSGSLLSLARCGGETDVPQGVWSVCGLLDTRVLRHGSCPINTVFILISVVLLVVPLLV